MKLGLALIVVAGCAGTDVAEPSTEVGITYTTMTEGVTAGQFDTAYGSVTFRSEVSAGGIVDVTFDRGAGAFGSHVDWTKMRNDLTFAPGMTITADDRFLMKALASSLEADLGNDTPANDNLVRQAILWGHHPEGAVTATHIEADVQRGWTTLCGANNATFTHDASSHGAQSEYLAAGRYETANPCRDRCGAGCRGVGTSAWTRDCGNHDRCEQLHSTSNCNDEFASASDDFTFAGNCSY